jgi:hypothetical protein
MQKKTENMDLLEDKAIVEKLFSTDAMSKYNTTIESVPADYFEQFESKLLNEIKQPAKVKSLFAIPKWGQIAIAASFFTIVATAYLVIQANNKSDITEYNISLAEISTTEIDAYVNENEELAEIDWQTEISNEGKNLESLNTHLIKDTNIAQ